MAIKIELFILDMFFFINYYRLKTKSEEMGLIFMRTTNSLSKIKRITLGILFLF